MEGMKKIYLYLWGVVFLAFGVLVLKDRLAPQKENTPAPSVSTSQVVTASSSAASQVSLIRIFSPVFDELVASPFSLQGEVAYATRLGYRLKDATGEIITEGAVMAADGGAGQSKTFKTEINFSDFQTATGTLEVFDSVSDSESQAAILTIPVAFRP